MKKSSDSGSGGDGEDRARRVLLEDGGGSAGAAFEGGPRRVLAEGGGLAGAGAGVGEEGFGQGLRVGEQEAGASGIGGKHLGSMPTNVSRREEEASGEGRQGGAAEGTGDRQEGGEEEEDEGEEEAYVRVTFQGQPVTHRITDCRTAPEG